MIGIIGSGLAGLTAGKVLTENGIDFILLEASDRIGGRVKTDEFEGYLLDHGFQVLLTSYPQVQKHLDLNALQLESFSPGAKIYYEGALSTISDPLREPTTLLKTLLSPLTSFSDSLKVLKLKSSYAGPEIQTIDFLNRYGFSTRFIDGFFKPFFSGVFLESELKSPANYFSFLYDRFSKGLASLPKEGMQAIPKQLASNFKDKIKLNSKVMEIKEKNREVEVFLESGETLQFEKLIIAVEAPQLKKLFPNMDISTDKRDVTTLYYTSDYLSFNDKYLLLNSDQRGRVNHIAFPSNISSSYAPKNKSLISVNILDTRECDPDQIKHEIKSLGIIETDNWKHLKSYPISYAQPDVFYQGQKEWDTKRIVFAGDFTQTPSIEGSMKSGELAAKKIS